MTLRLAQASCADEAATHPGWQALLKRRPYGEAAVVEVTDKLRVDGTTELCHLSVSRSDEDPLNRFHQNIVEQGVLCPRRQSVPNTKQRDCGLKGITHYLHSQELLSDTHFIVLYISSVSCSVRVFFRVPR